MASIKKRLNKAGRTRFCVEVRIRGRYRSKTFKTRLEATTWAADVEREFAGGGADIPKDKSVADAFDRYAREVSPGKKGARWETIRLKKIGRADLASIMLCNVAPDDISDWMESALKTLNPSTVRREIGLISAVFETARKKWKWIAVNPCQDIDWPSPSDPRDRRISADEEAKILAALKHREAAPTSTTHQVAIAFLVALETAMRQGEIFGLSWEHTFLDERYVHLPDTKNGKARNVPLSKRAVELLKLIGQKESGKVFTANQASAATLFRRAVARAKIEDLTFHDTRHEALTRLARKIDVLDLARMVGHKDPRMLMIYYNATAAEIAVRLG
jgi:integrase